MSQPTLPVAKLAAILKFGSTGFGVRETFLGTEHSMVTVFSSETRGLKNKRIKVVSIMGNWKIYLNSEAFLKINFNGFRVRETFLGNLARDGERVLLKNKGNEE